MGTEDGGAISESSTCAGEKMKIFLLVEWLGCGVSKGERYQSRDGGIVSLATEKGERAICYTIDINIWIPLEHPEVFTLNSDLSYVL